MKKGAYYALLLMMGCYGISCNTLAPSGFWKDFRKEALKRNISDQGPYGGHRAMYWLSPDAFTFDQIDHFADKNGWRFVDSTHFTSRDLETWKYGAKDIFPLTSKGFDPKIQTQDAAFDDFPRWISGDIELYRFITNWVLIDPGTDIKHPAYGYVMIDRKQTQLSVYHCWGD